MRRLRAGSVVLAVLLASGGCGGDGFPDEEPTDGPVTARGPAAASGPDISGAPSVGATRAEDGRGAGATVAACPSVAAAAKVRGGLPDLTLECLGSGAPTRLSALRGPLLLNVWASWCGPCADETPFLVTAQRALGARVTFLGIDVADAPKQAREWLRFLGVAYPSLQDPDGRVRSKLRVPGPPATLFVRSDGTVAKVHYGAFTSAREVASAVATNLGVRS